MYSFLKKMAGAVTGSIGAWSLSWIGYDSLATVQTEAVSNAIYTVSVLIPGDLYDRYIPADRVYVSTDKGIGSKRKQGGNSK